MHLRFVVPSVMCKAVVNDYSLEVPAY